MGTFISSDVKVDLVINKVTTDTYKQLSAHGLIDQNQLYIVEDTIVDTFGKRIVGVGDPVLSSDAATKSYVDGSLSSALGAKVDKEAGKGIVAVASDGNPLSAHQLAHSGMRLFLNEDSYRPCWTTPFGN